MSLVFRVRGTGRNETWMLSTKQIISIRCNYCPASAPPRPLSFISSTQRGAVGSSKTPHSALAEATQLRREIGVAWGFHSSMSSPPTATSNSWYLGASQVALVIKNLPATTGDTRDAGSIPGSGRFPWRRAWQSMPVFLPRESYGQRSLRGYSPWGRQESNTTEVT